MGSVSSPSDHCSSSPLSEFLHLYCKEMIPADLCQDDLDVTPPSDSCLSIESVWMYLQLANLSISTSIER